MKSRQSRSHATALWSRMACAWLRRREAYWKSCKIGCEKDYLSSPTLRLEDEEHVSAAHFGGCFRYSTALKGDSAWGWGMAEALISVLWHVPSVAPFWDSSRIRSWNIIPSMNAYYRISGCYLLRLCMSYHTVRSHKSADSMKSRLAISSDYTKTSAEC